MSDQSTRTIPWLRILVEGAVIVVSVLLALAADAWWDGRQARAAERVILLGLRGDYQATGDTVADVSERYTSVATAAERLIRLGSSGHGALSAAGMDSLLSNILPGNPFRPADVTLTTLMSSDGLGIIRDPNLRSKLTEWSLLLARVRRIEGQNDGQFLNYFMPYLYDRVPVRTLDAIGSTDISNVPSAFDRDARNLLGDLRFENHVNDVLFYNRQLTRVMAEVQRHIEETLPLIEGALGTE